MFDFVKTFFKNNERVAFFGLGNITGFMGGILSPKVVKVAKNMISGKYRRR